MKTGSVAHKLGIRSPKTIISWTEMFSEFFSESAKGGNGLQRDYNHNDLAVINTIRVERQRDTDWEEIRKKLDSGYLESSLPLEATVIEGENALAVYGQIKSLESALAVANSELERLRTESKSEIERLHNENENIRSEYKQREEQIIHTTREREAQLANDIKQLNTEIKELFGEVGAWRARFEMLKERLDDHDKNK